MTATPRWFGLGNRVPERIYLLEITGRLNMKVAQCYVLGELHKLFQEFCSLNVAFPCMPMSNH